VRDNGKVVALRVHRLVALAFIPNPEGLPQVNHIDGDKRNNRVENLEWVSNQENIDHAVRNGLMLRGEQVYGAKLKREDVVEIRRLRADEGLTQKEISKRFGISRAQVGYIVRREKWSHIP
jgi:DNA-binding transcriptional regulator YiaG